MMRSRFTSVPPVYWMFSSPGLSGAAARFARPGARRPGPRFARAPELQPRAAAIIVPDKRKSRRWTSIHPSHVFVGASVAENCVRDAGLSCPS